MDSDHSGHGSQILISIASSMIPFTLLDATITMSMYMRAPSSSQTNIAPKPREIFSLRTIVLILLPLLSALGAFGTWVLGISNGTFESITDLLAQDVPLLPQSDDVLLRTYTGISFVDFQLQILVAFFAPVVDSKNIDLTLFSIFGFGQFGAAWSLLFIESLRAGNKGKIVSFIGTVGMLIQNISYTVTVPLYLTLHLITSPVAKPFPGNHVNSALLVPTLDLNILPLSVTAGYLIPSILMVLPAPGVVSPKVHQQYIALWQAFPIWTVVVHWLLRYVIGKSFKSDVNKHPPTVLGTAYLSTAKYVYQFILVLCMITHIPVLAIILLPSWILTGFFSIDPLLIVNSTFIDVFIPYYPALSYKIPHLAAGSLTFLQWDIYVGSASLLVWGVLLYQNATTEGTIVDPDTRLPIYGRSYDGMLPRKLAWKITSWTLLSGPIGAMTVLLWERDMIVRQKIKQGQ